MLPEKIKEMKRLICRIIFKAEFAIIVICSLSFINGEHLRKIEGQMCILKAAQDIIQSEAGTKCIHNAYEINIQFTMAVTHYTYNA